MTKMSSKGQIVIPQEFRENITIGEKLIVIKNKDQLIIKKASSLKERLKKDLEFAYLTEKSYQKHLEGKFKSMDSEGFLEELKKW